MTQAKYKLINRDNGLAEPVYYCSKCTITLVQEGYSVEQLTQEELRGLAIADHPFKVMAEVD